MKKLNEKTIRLILIISVSLNILFLGYGIRKIIFKYHQSKSKQIIEVKVNSNLQPDKITYYFGRNEVFEKLPNDTAEIIMLGSSLAPNFEWHEIFKNANIKNRGIGGDISKGILQRLNVVIENYPKKIFIEIGINDLLLGFPIDTIYNNYLKIIQTIKIKSPKTRIYIQNILPSDWKIYNTSKPVIDSVYILNNKLKNYCDNNKLIYIDLFSKFLLEQRLNPIYDCGDNLHLSGRGYLLWCNLIRDYIND